jgi:hypothetical protein
MASRAHRAVVTDGVTSTIPCLIVENPDLPKIIDELLYYLALVKERKI